MKYLLSLNEYDHTIPLCISDSVDKLKEYAIESKHGARVFNEQWIENQGCYYLEFDTETYADDDAIYAASKFIIEHIEEI